VQQEFALVSASLLILYEGLPGSPGGDLVPRVRLIDFAHTFAAQRCLDDNFRSGLAAFMAALSSLVKSHATD
jgi:Inositol polyphosphate kinase